MLTPNLTINAAGHLCIGGTDTVTLAKTHGTPLYVMDENMIRENCRGFAGVIAEEYEGRGLICYASKALSCKELYRIVNAEGLGCDVVSGGELIVDGSVWLGEGDVILSGGELIVPGGAEALVLDAGTLTVAGGTVRES